MIRATAATLLVALILPAGALANPSHNPPASAPAKQISLVRAYQDCTSDQGLSPRSRAPLPAIACAASSASPLQFGAKGSGSLKLNVVKKSDVKAVGKLTKVMSGATPYTGGLSMLADARITDAGCGGEHCTVIDLPAVPISFANACKAGTCKFQTTFNALAPGIIVAGEQINMQFARVRVFDDNGQPAFQDGIAVGPAGKTKPLTTSLVSYLHQCTVIDPSLFHHSPLALSSCQPLPGSPLHFGAKGSGNLKATPNSAGEVLVTGAVKGIEAAGIPYAGDLQVLADVRVTDRGCAGSTQCTVANTTLPLTMPGACKDGKCKLKAKIGDQWPDLIRPADDLNMEVTHLRVADAGGNPAFEEGVAIP